MKRLGSKTRNWIERIFIVLALLTISWCGVRFYENRLAILDEQAKGAFNKALEIELAKRNLHDEIISRVPKDRSKTDSLPKIVSILTRQGEKIYKIAAQKDRRNITPEAHTRMKHSFALMENPLFLDTLNHSWLLELRKSGILAKTALRICTEEETGQTSSATTLNSDWCVSDSGLFSYSIGYRCEYEITGYTHYSWWFVLGMRGAGWLLGWAIAWGAVFYLLRMVLKASDRPIWIREVEPREPKKYKLCEQTLFDPGEKELLIEGVKHKISPQECVLLELFLTAEEYELTNEVIMKKLWPDGTGTKVKVQKAVGRLRNLFKENPSIQINYEYWDRYKLYLSY